MLPTSQTAHIFIVWTPSLLTLHVVVPVPPLLPTCNGAESLFVGGNLFLGHRKVIQTLLK